MAMVMGDIIARIKADTTDFQKGLAKSKSDVNSFMGGMVSASTKVVGAMAVVGSAIAGVGAIALKQAGNYEQSMIAFTTMLDSQERATAMLNDLAQMAKKTPFELQGIEQNAKQLLAMGIEADKIIPTLKAVGDVSAGLAVPLDRLAYNYGQVKAQGQLTGVELRDFARAGVPLIAELAENLNKTESEIKEMVSAGEIGFADVEKAFQTMTSEGGKFNNLMEAQSGSLQGQISNLKDEFNLLMREIGMVLLPVAKDVVVWIKDEAMPKLKELWQWLKDHQDIVKAVAIGITAMMIPAIVSMTIAMGALAVQVLIASAPLIALGVIVGALAYLIITNWDWIKEKTKMLWDYVVLAFNSIKDFLQGIGDKIYDSIVQPFINAWNKVKEVVDKIKEGLKKISPFHKESPSLVELVETGVGKIKDAYASLGDVSFTKSSTIASNAGAGVSNSKAVVQNINVYPSDGLDVDTIVERLAYKYRTSL